MEINHGVQKSPTNAHVFKYNVTFIIRTTGLNVIDLAISVMQNGQKVFFPNIRWNVIDLDILDAINILSVHEHNLPIATLEVIN